MQPFISSVLFPVCGLPSFVTVVSVYCLGRFLVYIHTSSPSLAPVLPGNPYVFLLFYFIPCISYLQPFHCPQVISPFPLFLIPFSFLILYFFFPQSVFHQRIRCFYFSRQLPSIFLILPLLSFNGTLAVFCVLSLMLCAGFSALSHLTLKNTLLLFFLFPLSLGLFYL